MLPRACYLFLVQNPVEFLFQFHDGEGQALALVVLPEAEFLELLAQVGGQLPFVELADDDAAETAEDLAHAVRQRVDDLRGSLRDFIRDAQVDETLFKAILRNMDCPRELFDHDLQEMSQGQRKKILLARSLCEPAHVFVWDEPLNYIDVFSRVQLETLIQQYQPTMLLVEHDKVFVERVATGVVEV